MHLVSTGYRVPLGYLKGMVQLSFPTLELPELALFIESPHAFCNSFLVHDTSLGL